MEIYNFLVPSRLLLLLLLLLYIGKKLNELKIYFNFRRILRYMNALPRDWTQRHLFWLKSIKLTDRLIESNTRNESCE